MSGTQVLLALHNGAAHITAQLDSIAAQTRPPASVLIRDDGSVDDGPERVRAWARAHPDIPVTLLTGPRLGFSNNFRALLERADPAASFCALSDQDDVWLPEKLERAERQLGAGGGDAPVLYGSRSWVCDAGLARARPSPPMPRPPAFANALVQSIAGGNTMVLNRAALRLAQAASHEAPDIVSHDWWLYQIVTGAGGRVIHDARPSLYYRQHGQNQIGANRSLGQQWTRLRLLLAGRFRDWSGVNLAALSASSHRLTGEHRDMLQRFGAARAAPLPARLRAFAKLGLYRQSRLGQAGLWLAIVTGRI